MSSFHSTPIEKYEISIRLLKTLRITCFVKRGEIKISKLSFKFAQQANFSNIFLLNFAIDLSSFHIFSHLAVERKCVHISSCISLTAVILILKTS